MLFNWIVSVIGLLYDAFKESIYVLILILIVSTAMQFCVFGYEEALLAAPLIITFMSYSMYWLVAVFWIAYMIFITIIFACVWILDGLFSHCGFRMGKYLHSNYRFREFMKASYVTQTFFPRFMDKKKVPDSDLEKRLLALEEQNNALMERLKFFTNNEADGRAGAQRK